MSPNRTLKGTFFLLDLLPVLRAKVSLNRTRMARMNPDYLRDFKKALSTDIIVWSDGIGTTDDKD
ncbi:MAG TPA: hypothetical protein VK106_06505 [Balneolaceae bacterium]|nr:hypothetical protein [Balneolaceae bacterium]